MTPLAATTQTHGESLEHARSIDQLQTLLKELELRNAEATRCARYEFSVAEAGAIDLKKQEEYQKQAESELDGSRFCSRQAAALYKHHCALRKEVAQVRALKRSQLDEVRSLVRPPAPVHAVLGLLYCVLHAEIAERFESAYDVPWKQAIVPMLHQEDLMKQLADFPPVGASHPLLEFPASEALLKKHLVGVIDTCHDSSAWEDFVSASLSASTDGNAMRKDVRRVAQQLSSASLRSSLAAQRSAQMVLNNSASESSGLGFRQPTRLSSSGKGFRSTSIPLQRSQSSGSIPCKLVGGEVAQARAKRNTSTAGNSTNVSSCLTQDKLALEVIRFSSRAVVALFQWVVSQLRSALVLKEAAVNDFAIFEAELRMTCESREAEVARSIAYLETTQADTARTTKMIELAQLAASEFVDSAAETFDEAERVRQDLLAAETTMAQANTLRSHVEAEATANVIEKREFEVAEALRLSTPHARRRLPKSASQPLMRLTCACKPPWLIEMTGPCKVHSSPVKTAEATGQAPRCVPPRQEEIGLKRGRFRCVRVYLS